MWNLHIFPPFSRKLPQPAEPHQHEDRAGASAQRGAEAQSHHEVPRGAYGEPFLGPGNGGWHMGYTWLNYQEMSNKCWVFHNPENMDV